MDPGVGYGSLVSRPSPLSLSSVKLTFTRLTTSPATGVYFMLGASAWSVPVPPSARTPLVGVGLARVDVVSVVRAVGAGVGDRALCSNHPPAHLRRTGYRGRSDSSTTRFVQDGTGIQFIAAVSLTWREFWDAPGQVLDKEPQAGAGSLRRLDGATPPAPSTGRDGRFRTQARFCRCALPQTVDVPGRPPGPRRASGLPRSRCR